MYVIMYVLLCQLTLFSERSVGGGSENEVVENVDAEQLARVVELERNGEILGGGSGIAGGVIVGEHDGGGEVADRGFENLAWMDEGAGEGADGDDLAVDKLVAGVEVEGDEVFFVFIANVGELIDGVLGRGDDGERIVVAVRGAARELESGEDGDGLGGADTFGLAEIVEGEVEKLGEWVLAQNLGGEIEGGVPCPPGTKENGEEFFVGEIGGAFGQ